MVYSMPIEEEQENLEPEHELINYHTPGAELNWTSTTSDSTYTEDGRSIQFQRRSVRHEISAVSRNSRGSSSITPRSLTRIPLISSSSPLAPRALGNRASRVTRNTEINSSPLVTVSTTRFIESSETFTSSSPPALAMRDLDFISEAIRNSQVNSDTGVSPFLTPRSLTRNPLLSFSPSFASQVGTMPRNRICQEATNTEIHSSPYAVRTEPPSITRELRPSQIPMNTTGSASRNRVQKPSQVFTNARGNSSRLASRVGNYTKNKAPRTHRAARNNRESSVFPDSDSFILIEDIPSSSRKPVSD